MNGGNTTRHTQQYKLSSTIGARINHVIRRVHTIFDILDQCVVPMSAKLPIDKQKFLLGSMQEGEMMILVWVPQIDSQDPDFDAWLALTDRYKNHTHLLANLISRGAGR